MPAIASKNRRASFPTSRFTEAHLFRVGLSFSSLVLGLRTGAAQPTMPFRVGSPPPRGWLDAGGTDPVSVSAVEIPARGELFFIDGAVADPNAFWLAAPTGATVVCVPPNVDSWQFMADEAANFRNLRAIHIISHGEPGALILNSHRYTAADLDLRSAALRTLGRALSKNGDILLYGCDTGRGADGARLVTTLAKFTGADIAASSNPTGGLPGADWNFEIATGEIETPVAAPASYAHDLAIWTATNNANTGVGSLRAAIASAQNGDIVTFNASMTVQLTSELLINKDITIDGDLNNDGAADVILDGQYRTRVLEIAAGKSVSLDGLVITRGLVSGTGGNGGYGATNSNAGGIFNAGNLTLNNVSATSNAASGGGGGGGVTGAFYGGGGGGGGGLGGQGGGHGGSAGPGTGTLGGGAGGGGVGGYGGGYDATHMGGRGGTSVGGAGGIGVSYYSNGGNGASATNGTLSIGGGGGGAGWDKIGGAGGNVVGGIYNASSGTMTVIGTSGITNNVGAGGGGGGGGGYGSNASNGGVGGRGVGAVWNKGTFLITAANFAALAGNAAASGAGGAALGGGTTGTSPTSVATIYNDGGVLNTAFNPPPTLGAVTANAVGQASAGLSSYSFTLAYADSNGAVDGTSVGTGDVTVSKGVTNLIISGASWDSGTNLATYTATPPGGTWDDADNGTWIIGLVGSQVADNQGAVVAANASAGSFVVSMDTTAPSVSSVAVPASATYIAGQNLDFTVNFSEAVTVNTGGGAPYINLTLDTGGTVQAAYLSGSGTSALIFRYTVAPGNVDANGIVLGVAITANGGTLKDTIGNDATLTLNSVGSTAAVRVDALAPSIVSGGVPANHTFTLGQTMDFTVSYDEGVTVNTGGGTPYIALTLDIGGAVQAPYVGGSGTNTLTFRYTVTSGTVDANGITASSAITSNGGTLKDAAGNDAPITGIAFASTTGVLVDGVVPSVSSINRVSSASTNASSVDYTVTFSENVTGVDVSDFTLTVTGTVSGTIASVTPINGTTYTVAVNSITGDGTSRLDLKSSGTGITDTPGNSVSAGFTSGQAYTFDHTAPSVSSVAVPANATYIAGQNLDFTVNFNEAVTVNTGGGTPYINLTLDTGGTVQAAYISGTGTSALIFRYTVVSGNADTNGIALGSAITANGGTLKDTIGNDATLTLTSVGSTAAVLVDARPPIIASVGVPANASYIAGQNLDFTVNFDEVVTVNIGGGTPRLELTIGSTTRYATYLSGSGTTALVFRYTTQTGDLDPNGIALAGLVEPNGGTVKDAVGNNADLTLNSVGSTTSVLVDAVAPTVASASVPSDATYIIGQNLTFTVTYSETVTVNTGGGTPYVGVTLDTGGAVQAAYLSGSGTAALTFRYTVAAGTLDPNGIAVASLITLNGGAIKDAATNDAQTTSLGFASTASVLVEGVAPTVSSINRVGATPSNASSVDYTVTFSENVTGVDTTDFTLTATGTASGTIANVAAINASTYTVTVNSITGDGTLRLDLKNAGTGIADISGNAITAGFTSGQTYTIDNTAPTVASVNVPANATYLAGEDLNFTVNVSENTTVNTGGGTPRIALTIGSTTRHATYLSGSGTTALVFRYTIQTGDLDADGIAVAASLDANGGSLRDAVGNDVNLTLNGVGSTASVLVDTVGPTISSATVPANATYAPGQNLDFTVTFSENVTVNSGGGTPYINLTLDTGGTVQAAYLSGSGTSALVFRYTVASGNADSNGIAVASAITLNGGTIKDAIGNNSATTSIVFASTAGVLVDGIAPTLASSDRQTPSGASTNATSVIYRVTFAESVTGVDTTDFTVTATGTAAGTVASIAPVSGSVYDVTVNTISGDGTLRLDLKASGTGIADTATNAIAAGFTAGQTYTIDNTTPTLISILRQTPATVNTAAASVTYRATFNEGVSGVDTNDFSLTVVSGTASGAIGTVTPVSTSVYDVAITSLAGIGALRLDLKASGTGIADLPGNVLASGGFTSGDVYLIGTTDVFDTVSLATGTTRTVSNAITNKVAQRFTTAAAAPLALTTVTAAFGSITGTPTPVVTVNADNAGAIGSVVATLTNPANFTANSLNTWRTTTQLTGSTTYWIVFGDTSVAGAYAIKETAATTGGTGTWLTNNDYVYLHGANAATGPQAGALQIALGATSIPTITSGLTASATYGSAFTYAITATNLPTSFAATGLPTGLTLNASTGAISGAPTQSGSFNVALTGTNGSGTSSPSTLVLTVAKAALTVIANNQTRSYGTDSAFSVSYSGFVNSDSAGSLGSLPIATTTATFASPAGNYAIIASGGSSPNYTFTYVGGTLTITTAGVVVPPVPPAPPPPPIGSSQGITLSGLSQTYTGTPRIVTATTTPAGQTVNVTYNNSATPPTAAGTYAIGAAIANSSGSTFGLLVVAKATQTIAFASIASSVTIGASTNLSATASSGLPVTFSLVSGNATLSGSALKFNDGGSVTVRAAQAGDANNNAASVDQTIAPAKLAQTITFAALADRNTNTDPFTVSATASSGLPVAITMVSGPAVISGSSVTLTGAAGTVELRASQPGNATYLAAPAVSRSFTVTSAGPRVFIGDVVNDAGSKLGDIAAVLPPSGNDGNLVIVAPRVSVILTIAFTLQSDGTFVMVIVDDGGVTPQLGDGPRRERVARTLTLRARLVGNVLSGRIDEIPMTFSISLQGRGTTTAAAGFYQSSTLNSASGSTDTIVGNNGEVVVLAVTGGTTVGGRTTLNANGTFDLTDNAIRVTGAIDAPNSTVTGNISQPGKADIGFSGIPTTTRRTDRLINLSSRNRVGPGARALITGFVISGLQPKQVLVRAAGPALTAFGIGSALRNPRLQLYRDGQLVNENDDWRQSSNAADIATTATRIGAFPFAIDSRDAALLVSLAPGAYTAIVVDDTGEGVGLAEIYDASVNPQAENQRLVNISTRGESSPGEGVLIGGIVVTGNTPKRLLIRGVGPGLAAFGVAGALTDSTLKLYDSAGKLVAQNDNWETPQPLTTTLVSATGAEIALAAGKTGAFALTAGSKDSAIVITLAAGAYTAHVLGANGQTGIALIEVYEIQE